MQENNLENPWGKKCIGPIPALKVACAQIILADDNEGTRHLQDLMKLRVFSLKTTWLFLLTKEIINCKYPN